MIVRQFISWVRTAPAGERAEATRALARAWLISDLSDDDRAAAEGGLLMQLDDPSPLVRRAMAEVFARSATAPAAIVQALSVDQPSVAIPVLEHSPLLIDADLVDIVATGSCDVQCAVARRVSVPVSVCAAIAEVGSAAAALELIENPGADLAPMSWDRIVERHGHLAAIRESMLALDDLPAATRLALVGKLSDTLAQFVVARNWLNADRAGRAVSDARDRSIVNIAARSRGDDMCGLVAASARHRATHRRIDLARAAVGQSRSVRSCAGGTVGPAFELASPRWFMIAAARACRAADAGGLAGIHIPCVSRRAGSARRDWLCGTVGGATRLRRRMVERVLTMCETAPTEVSEPLLILLRRFATESAREEARVFCDELVAEAAAEPACDKVEECRFASPVLRASVRVLNLSSTNPSLTSSSLTNSSLTKSSLTKSSLTNPRATNRGRYAIESCEPERREPRFDEPAPYEPRRREPLLSDLLAAA